MENNSRIAAIFDVDGTLIAGASLERIFIRYLWRRGELGWRDLIGWTSGFAEALVAGRSPIRANKSYLRGKDSALMRRLARECFDGEIARRLSQQAVDRLRWHQDSGHFVILMSGTLDLLLEPLAEHLGICARIGTELEVEGGRFTGRIRGLHPFGETKAECLSVIDRIGLFDLKRSFAYADNHADRHLLSMVGNPVAANADAGLRRIAASSGWMTEDFTCDFSRKPAEQSYGRA
jgi:HAD superfamily hydrolase (TIGR01490 family)